MRVDFVTLFPGMVRAALSDSIMARAEAKGLVRFGFADPRDYCYDRHRKVDDAPYGGGPGMLMKAEPVALALEALRPAKDAAVILTSPTGRPFTQPEATSLAKRSHVVFLCGHYEGIDARVEAALCTHSFSIGDFVLTNGELPALVMADAIIRTRPGVLGSEESLAADSHSEGLLSAPTYTRPEVWRGLEVPGVLRSGDHAAVARWNRREALRLTRLRRPDLLARATLAKDDLDMLSS